MTAGRKRPTALETPSERKECQNYYKLCSMQNILTIHITNEGKRTSAGGGILKSMGLTVGTPDFVHPVMRGGWGALWIEMKRNKKYTPSERSKPTWIAQERMIAKLIEAGHFAMFAYGWEHAQRIRDYYLSLPNTNNQYQNKIKIGDFILQDAKQQEKKGVL